MKSRIFILAATVCVSSAIVHGSHAGTLTVKFGSAMEVEIDGKVQTFENGSTFTPTAIPCIYKMRPVLAAGERTYGIYGDDKIGSYTHARFPLPGEGNWVRVALDPYPAEDTVVKLTGMKVSKIYYADAQNGNDEWDGTTDYENRDEENRKGPKKTLQAAHDGAEAGSNSKGFPIVLVAPGYYKDKGKTIYSDSGHLLDGSSNPCKRRLVITKSIGFIAEKGPEKTFIVGERDSGADNGFGDNSIAGVYASGDGKKFIQGFTITGCYLPANQANNVQYGAAYASGNNNGYILDCVISNNYAKKYSCSTYGIFERTRILNNESHQYAAYSGTFISCIFTENRISIGNDNSPSCALHDSSVTLFCTYDLRNELNKNGRARLHKGGGIYAALVYALTDKTTVDEKWYFSQAIDEPLFADVDGLDYRLLPLSPALAANSYELDLNERARSCMMADIDGRMPIIDDGKMRLGAVWNNIYQKWYVDCVNGNDENSGVQGSPKKTLRSALANAIGGDVVYVAPGTYGEKEGVQKHVANAETYSRVIIPPGVSLQSTKGAKETVIAGAAAPQDAANEYGNGSGAVRCVYAKDGAKLKGFTLTGGHTALAAVNTAASYGTSGDTYGAALLTGKNDWAYLEDCIVSNNVGHYATVFRSTVKNCRIQGNDSGSALNPSAVAGSECHYISTIIDGNKGAATIHSPQKIENCTIGTNKYNNNGTQVVYKYGSTGSVIVNSLFLYDKDRFYGAIYATNSLFSCAETVVTANSSVEDCLWSQTPAELKVGSDYGLLPGSKAIDAGGNHLVSMDLATEKDFCGNRRVSNATVDIGAVEYDWRPTFAARIGKKIALTDVSPSVTTNVAGGLLLGQGKIAGYVSEEGYYDFAFSISGGVLEAFMDGESIGVYSAAGNCTVRMKMIAEGAEFAFVFTPDAENPGAATFKSANKVDGFVLSIR